MALSDVYVVGVGMHPITSKGIAVRDMAYEASTRALSDAGMNFGEIEYVYNGYRPVDPAVTGVLITKDLGLNGAPITQVENTSATGSTAFREAVLKVSSGEVRTAMANGWSANVMRWTAENVWSEPMRAAVIENGPDSHSVDEERPRIDANLLPNALFAMWAVRRMHEVGTTVETYAAIAAKNWNNARTNPYARRRSDHVVTIDEVLSSRKIAYPHTSMMSAATGAGAACAILANRKTAERIAQAQNRPMIGVISSQMQSELFVPGTLFMGAVVGPPDLTRTTAARAYEQAGMAPSDIDFVHVHDAFPVEELLYMELLGLCAPGEADKLVAEGATALGGRIPFSPDGGLIARGHPVGPTGLAQIWDTVTQLRGEAGPRQIEGARVGLAHMMGGGSVCIVHILARQ